MSGSTSKLSMRLVPLNIDFYFADHSKAGLFVICVSWLSLLSCLFVAALWSPAGKR